MKTVSTKLDNTLHNQFIEVCNEDGKCQSEFLRDLIQSVCEDLGKGEATPQDLEIEHVTKPSESILELKKPTVEIIYDE